MNDVFIQNFRSHQFSTKVSHLDSVKWLKNRLARLAPSFEKKLALRLYDQLAKQDYNHFRHSSIEDYAKLDAAEFDFFSELENGKQPLLEKRMRQFQQAGTNAAEVLLPSSIQPPKYLNQISCTGYESPSVAQLAIGKNGWQTATKYLSVGHMGCHAAMPSAEMAVALATSNPLKSITNLHIEMCSLHLDVEALRRDKIMANMLFADGAIAYDFSTKSSDKSFLWLGAEEAIIPASVDAMSWKINSQSFDQYLSKSIPKFIKANVGEYVCEFLKKRNLKISEVDHFAIHPGGPKIIESTAEVLEVAQQEKIQHSIKVLQEYGNMSSATLPHVWMNLLNDDYVAPGASILSIAFGPGLTVYCSLMKKVA